MSPSDTERLLTMQEITRNAVAAAMPDLFTLVGQIETSLKAVRTCADKFEAVAPGWTLVDFDSDADEGEPYRLLIKLDTEQRETVIYADGESWYDGDIVDLDWTEDQEEALSQLVYAAIGAQYAWGTLACTVWHGLSAK